ncbi:hypothetical protein O181_021292 [Austropuccinia psidii MF-1]|uniref:Uncharacterized protein n=1 Tax=Austropuccinia psidii MF-1 TaxID=1389203 RepID=A0A9Q3CF98_9BASI|nr:hypothetical protein [Austropuccinia psidii MF-1]
MIGPELFKEDILLNIMAFYSLKLLLSSLKPMENDIYQATKLSGKMPTLEEVFSEVELTLSRGVEGSDNAQVLKVHGRNPRCFGGKHNPLAPHAESECFQLHPEKRDSYHSRMKHKDDKKDSQSNAPQVFAAFSKCLEEGHTVLDSGASFSLFKMSRRFVTYHPTNIPLYLEDGSCVYAVVMGTAAILSETGRVLNLKNSLVVPSFSS